MDILTIVLLISVSLNTISLFLDANLIFKVISLVVSIAAFILAFKAYKKG